VCWCYAAGVVVGDVVSGYHITNNGYCPVQWMDCNLPCGVTLCSGKNFRGVGERQMRSLLLQQHLKRNDLSRYLCASYAVCVDAAKCCIL